MITVKEAAKLLGVSEALVYALCASHRLRHSRVGTGRGVIRISVEAISEYLNQQEVGPAPPTPQPKPPKPLKLEHLRLP
jgi:excisionase family DNA binding protein